MTRKSSLITDQAPENMPAHLFLPWQQAQIAVRCLSEKLPTESIQQEGLSEAKGEGNTGVSGVEMAHPVLPYLIHASVLFFLIRDLLAFEVIRQQDAFKQSLLPQKLRQMPSYQQLMALLNSVAKTQPLLALIQPISNHVLPIEHLQVFRNAVIQHGIPLDTRMGSTLQESAETTHPFPLPPVDYDALSRQLLDAWEQLNQWLKDKKPFPLVPVSTGSAS
ncbi:MAG: hypothetical protein VKJ04_00625 [Vampirovibrionales bacterium]|nr:hypothetical protein [Vampirovibrionales bacterium]